jgi:putative DNA primase/helicase
MHEDAAILSQVRGYFEKYRESKFTLCVTDPEEQAEILKKSNQQRAGFRWLNDDGRFEYFVLRECFNNEICAGYSPRNVAKLLVAKGILCPGNDGRPSIVHSLPGLGLVRCYYFLSSLLEYSEA